MKGIYFQFIYFIFQIYNYFNLGYCTNNNLELSLMLSGCLRLPSDKLTFLLVALFWLTFSNLFSPEGTVVEVKENGGLHRNTDQWKQKPLILVLMGGCRSDCYQAYPAPVLPSALPRENGTLLLKFC